MGTAREQWWRRCYLLLLPSVVTREVASEESPAGNGPWQVTTLAGNAGAYSLGHVSPCREAGEAEQRKFAAPWAVSQATFAAPTRVQVVNGTVFVMDGENGCIRTIANGLVSPATPCCGKHGGEDVSVGADGDGPQDMHVTADHFYLMDSYSYQLKRASRPFDKWVVLAGNGSRPHKGRSTDGVATEQALNEPHGMAVTSDGSGDVYIAETWSSCIRLYRKGRLATVAGLCGTGGHADGHPRQQARFQHMHHINLDPRNESRLYVSDVECYDDDRFPDDQKYRPCASTDGGVCFSGLRLVELDRQPNGAGTGLGLRVSTIAGGHSAAKKVHTLEKECNGFADGNSTVARFNYIHGTAFQALSAEELQLQRENKLSALAGSAGGSRFIFVCDEGNSRIRRVDLTTHETHTVAGSGHTGGVHHSPKDGPGPEAEFRFPGGLGVAADGVIYVGDYAANRIRKITPPPQRGRTA